MLPVAPPGDFSLNSLREYDPIAFGIEFDGQLIYPHSF
jgi:hypothetical protein